MQQVLSELKSINLNMSDLSYINTFNEDLCNDSIINLDDDNEIVINELLLLYEDFIQKGIYYEDDDYIQLIIKKHITSKNKNVNEIFNYLLNNNNKNKQTINLFAIFYRYGIGTEKNEMKAFELYEEMNRKTFVEPGIKNEKSDSNTLYVKDVMNAQEYINQKYPTKKEKEKEIRLIINNKNLEGHLDLSEFINLENLNCSNNQLTGLDIRKNIRLIDLDCSQNNLTNLDLTYCTNITFIRANYNQLNDIRLPISNNEKLIYLNLLDNSLSQNLSYFSCFVNIKQLFIGNTIKDRIQQGIYNRFHGSLKPLNSLIKLKSLNINNTDLDSGLEYLPDSVKNFRCSIDKRPEAKVKKIYELLEIFAIDVIDALKGKYNLKAWKKNWKLFKEHNKSALNGKEYLDVQIKNESQSLQSEQDVNILQQQVHDLKVKLEQMNVIYQETRQKLEEKVSHKETNSLKDELLTKENNELKVKEGEYAKLKSQLIKFRSFISNIKSRKEELKYLKKKLDEQKFETRTSTANLRRQMSDLKKEISSSWTQLVKAMKIDNIEVNLEKLEISNYQLKNNEDFINKSQLQTQQHIEELKKQLNEETIKYENSQEKLTILDNQLKDKENLINKLQQQNNELKRRLKEMNNLYPQIENKEIELREIINTVTIRSEIGKKGKRLLDNLLEEQIKIVITDDSFSSEKLEKIKLKLSEEEELTKEEIQNILIKQTEITWLKVQFKSFQD
jgi:hypothetical protein